MVCMFKAIQFCYLMYLRTFGISALKCMNSIDPADFLTTPRLAWQEALKKTKVKLDLLTDIALLLMLEKGIKVEYAMLFIDM